MSVRRATTAATLLALAGVRLAAQWGGYAALGARAGTSLVHDVIVQPIDLRQTVALTVAAGVTTPTEGAWSGEAALDVTAGGLRRDEAAATLDLGGLTTVSFTVAVRRALGPGFAARAGAGALFYMPEHDAGVFRDGTAGATPVGLVGVTWAPAVGKRRRLALDLRYDVHRFITPALRDVGFTESRVVHRLALAVRAGIGGAP